MSGQGGVAVNKAAQSRRLLPTKPRPPDFPKSKHSQSPESSPPCLPPLRIPPVISVVGLAAAALISQQMTSLLFHIPRLLLCRRLHRRGYVLSRTCPIVLLPQFDREPNVNTSLVAPARFPIANHRRLGTTDNPTIPSFPSWGCPASSPVSCGPSFSFAWFLFQATIPPACTHSFPTTSSNYSTHNHRRFRRCAIGPHSTLATPISP